MAASLNEIRRVALQLLARREHSQQQLTAKLRQREFILADIAAVLRLLVQQGLLCDKRFTQAYIESRVNRGFGPQRIRSELEARGIESAMIDDLLDEQGDVWLQRAMTVTMKKFQIGVSREYKVQMKQKRFLQYRGFTGEQIQQVFADWHDE